MKKKNPKKVEGGRKAWRGNNRKKWFQAEKKFRKKLEKEGCEILAYRGGYPDFMYRKNGKIKFVELKKGNDSLSDKQQKVLSTFDELGFEVKVLRYVNRKFNEDKHWKF